MPVWNRFKHVQTCFQNSHHHCHHHDDRNQLEARASTPHWWSPANITSVWNHIFEHVSSCFKHVKTEGGAAEACFTVIVITVIIVIKPVWNMLKHVSNWKSCKSTLFGTLALYSREQVIIKIYASKNHICLEPHVWTRFKLFQTYQNRGGGCSKHVLLS